MRTFIFTAKNAPVTSHHWYPNAPTSTANPTLSGFPKINIIFIDMDKIFISVIDCSGTSMQF